MRIMMFLRNDILSRQDVWYFIADSLGHCDLFRMKFSLSLSDVVRHYVNN